MKKISVYLTGIGLLGLTIFILTLSSCGKNSNGGQQSGCCCCCGGGGGGMGGGNGSGQSGIKSGKPTTIVMAPGFSATGSFPESPYSFTFYETTVQIGQGIGPTDPANPVAIYISAAPGSYGNTHIEVQDVTLSPPPPGTWASYIFPLTPGGISPAALIPGGIGPRTIKVRVLLDNAYGPNSNPPITPNVYGNPYSNVMYTMSMGGINSVFTVLIADQGYLSP
jgi:hypothetical protein